MKIFSFHDVGSIDACHFFSVFLLSQRHPCLQSPVWSVCQFFNWAHIRRIGHVCCLCQCVSENMWRRKWWTGTKKSRTIGKDKVTVVKKGNTLCEQRIHVWVRCCRNIFAFVVCEAKRNHLITLSYFCFSWDHQVWDNIYNNMQVFSSSNVLFEVKHGQSS